MGEGLRVPLLVGLGAGMIGSGLGVWANKSVSLQMARDEEREGQGGKTTVKVRTEDRQREEARKILMRAGAIEVEEEGLS